MRSRARTGTRRPSCWVARVVAIAWVFVALQSGAAFAACGGTERWFVKVGTDPDAGLVPLNQIVPITVTGLNSLPIDL